jgi:hypothetical protein
MSDSKTNLTPGSYFPTATVVEHNATGRSVWVECKTGANGVIRAILPLTYVTNAKSLRKGQTLRSLVVIFTKNSTIHVACDNYFEDLCKALYTKQGEYRQPMPEWEASWKEDCSQSKYPETFHIQECPKCKYGIPRTQNWFEVRGSSFVLPVRSSLFLGTLRGKPLYCPRSAYTSEEDEKRGIYKFDDVDQEPSLWEAETCPAENSSRVKQMHICLHGFVSPAKWHFGIWKHVCGYAPSHYPDDGLHTWNRQFNPCVRCPDESTFYKCQENRDKTSCNEPECNDSNFQSVHHKIRDLCQRYFRELVTFFGKSTSKVMYVWGSSRKRTGPKKVEVIAVCDPNHSQGSTMAAALAKVGMMNNSCNIKGRLVLRGACHDWDSVSPTVHLTPVTFFLGDNVRIDSRPSHKTCGESSKIWVIKSLWGNSLE